MNDFQQKNELYKTLKRFNKIRLYHNYGYRNILPIKYLKKNPHNYQQIQLNTKNHFNAIIMDIDEEELLTEWSAIGLPTPTIQTVNKSNNKAHLVWLLNKPVYKKHKHVVSYYKSIVNSIKELIGADKAYQNHETKNFLNKKLFRVTYNDIAYDLGDFRKYIIYDEKFKQSSYDCVQEFISTGSRHLDLFEQLRFYGYKVAKKRNLFELLEDRAEKINTTFEEPIKTKYIVKSIYKFCEENKNNFKAARQYRTGAMKNKKIQNLTYQNYIKEVSRRQSKSAQRTKDIKRLKTAAKIKVAVNALMRNKTKLTYSSIAKQAKCSLSTAKRYSKIIKFFLRKKDSVVSSIRLIVLDAGEASSLHLKYYFAPAAKMKYIRRCQHSNE